jgi:hypothetical protein
VTWRLDDVAVGRQHEIAVRAGRAVLDVVEVQHRRAIVDAAADGGNLAADRIGGDLAGGDRLVDRDAEGNPGAGDRGGAGAAVGLDDVAIERDLAFAEFLEIDDGAQAAADQPLDFLRATGLLARGGFAASAGVGGARQHAIFGGDPPLALAAQPGRHVRLH